MKKTFVMFDLDGTLLDTISTIAYYCNAALSHFGFSSNNVEDYKRFVGDGSKMLVRRALAAHGNDTDENVKKVHPYYVETYNRHSTHLTTHFPHMPETLQMLKEKGVKMAIVSNKPQSSVDYIVPLFFTEEDLFCEKIGGKEGYPLKPDPYHVNRIIEKYGLKKEEVLYVGDMATDMQVGKNAGVDTVGVLWGFRGKDELVQNGATHIIDTPDALLTLL